ncbi:hypothetical protein N2152v2_008054 [Parachlorella kessleri]
MAPSQYALAVGDGVGRKLFRRLLTDEYNIVENVIECFPRADFDRHVQEAALQLAALEQMPADTAPFNREQQQEQLERRLEHAGSTPAHHPDFLRLDRQQGKRPAEFSPPNISRHRSAGEPGGAGISGRAAGAGAGSGAYFGATGSRQFEVPSSSGRAAGAGAGSGSCFDASGSRLFGVASGSGTAAVAGCGGARVAGQGQGPSAGPILAGRIFFLPSKPTKQPYKHEGTDAARAILTSGMPESRWMMARVEKTFGSNCKCLGKGAGMSAAEAKAAGLCQMAAEGKSRFGGERLFLVALAQRTGEQAPLPLMACSPRCAMNLVPERVLGATVPPFRQYLTATPGMAALQPHDRLRELTNADRAVLELRWCVRYEEPQVDPSNE